MRRITAALLVAAFALAFLASQGVAARKFHQDRSGSTIVAQ